MGSSKEPIKKLNIFILSVQPFPIGMAATNRIISYCKGFYEEGHFVQVLNIRPTENARSIVNDSTSGFYQGIHYKYTSGTTIWPSNKIGRLYIYMKGILYGMTILIRQRSKADIILSASVNFFLNSIFKIISKIVHVKYVKVEDEYPIMFIDHKRKYSRIYTRFYLKYFFKLFDGMIVMTHSLKDYYKKLVRKNIPILVSPMTVEPERFSAIKKINKENTKYIAYAGYLGGEKDGIQNLMKSFKIFLSQTSENIKLYLIGYTDNNEELLSLTMLAQELGVHDKIVFTGKVHRDQIPYYLCGASLLVLARPDNKQAEGGFPTKLGEYLATGKPVLVTKVGEIPRYLTDKVNVFLAEPNDIEDFASKMLYIFRNYQFAESIAVEGRKLVYDVFNYRIQAKRMIDFLNN